MAEKGEETVYQTRVAIVSDRLERAERVALGLSARVRTGPPWVEPGHDRKEARTHRSRLDAVGITRSGHR
jgi:hypothetical protein